MPNPDISHDGRGRSPSAQKNRRHERRSKAPGSAGASVNAVRRERHRDGKRRSSASRRKRRKHGREREARRSPEKPDGFDRDVHGLAVEYDDVSSQSERFSGSPSPRAEQWAELAELRDGDVTPGRRPRREPDPSASRQDRDLKIKDQKPSREKDALSKTRERTRNHDSNGKKSSADNKREAKRPKSRTKSEKEPPSAYRDTPQAYRDERDEVRAYRRSPGFNKAESPYSSYPYGYQSPSYNQFSSYGSKRPSPSSTYYSRDAEQYSGYSASKSPSKRKRSPGSPYAWRRSPSPYEAWEHTSSPYSRKRSRSPYRKSVSPSPEQR